MPRNPSFPPIHISSVDDRQKSTGRSSSSRIKRQQQRIPRRHHRPAFNDHDVSSSSSNLSAMKIFNRFRKLIVRLLFSVGGKKGSDNYQAAAERADPPKTSCSSYYSTQLHYSEAIADCIEFLNKAGYSAGSPDGSPSSSDHGPQPDVWV